MHHNNYILTFYILHTMEFFSKTKKTSDYTTCIINGLMDRRSHVLFVIAYGNLYK